MADCSLIVWLLREKRKSIAGACGIPWWGGSSLGVFCSREEGGVGLPEGVVFHNLRIVMGLRK